MRKIVMTSLLALAAGTTVGHASDIAVGVQRAELIPVLTAGKSFGISVAIDGDFVLVGEPEQNRAVLFDISSLDNPVERLVYEGVLSQNHNDSRFGMSVGIVGNNVVIGDAGADEINTEPGVSTYKTEDNVRRDRFQDDRNSTDFGFSLSMNGTDILVGSPDALFVGARIGAAYFMNIDTFPANTRVGPSEGADPFSEDDLYGQSVALSSSYAAIGAPDLWEGGQIIGVVDIRRSDNTWVQLKEVTGGGSVREPGDRFGYSVALSEDNGVNNLVLIGAPRNNRSGEAFIFDMDTGNQIMRLTPSDPQNQNRFGDSVALTENYAIVGAPGAFNTGTGASFVGSVYIFDRATGQEIGKFFPTTSHQATWESFGDSVAVSGPSLIVGASATDFSYPYQTGSAFVFDLRCNEADFAAPYGSLNFFDTSAFLAAFAAEDPNADINGDGSFNFFDVSAFLALISAGCP
jgi:FG-GAP repeat protein